MNENRPETNDGPAGGDAPARVQQLFIRHQGIIKAFILSLQPGFADADDVLQETFLVVTRRAADYREGSNFTAWACAIARFKLFEARRRATSPTLTEEALAALCDDAPDEAFLQERLPALRECLRRLAPRARELVWLRYHSELASETIARQLEWKEPAVRVALSKARAFLRDCVQGQLAKGQP
jgi:RNA polymerase sigma-70 factor (ECF subfamily)